jgi:hypothetical protein
MGLIEKRKNDRPRGWLLLVTGFVLGVIATLLVVVVLPQVRITSEGVEAQPDLALTATTLIQQATGTAHVVMTSQAFATPPAEIDPIYLTATTIIQQATQRAANAD